MSRPWSALTWASLHRHLQHKVARGGLVLDDADHVRRGLGGEACGIEEKVRGVRLAAEMDGVQAQPG